MNGAAHLQPHGEGIVPVLTRAHGTFPQIHAMDDDAGNRPSGFGVALFCACGRLRESSFKYGIKRVGNGRIGAFSGWRRRDGQGHP